MPRKAKTLSGAPAQAPTAPRGGPYGEGERALESQRRAPLPDIAAQAAGAVQTPAGSGGAPGMDPMMAAMAAAQGMAPPSSALTTPSERPGETLMAQSRDGTPPAQRPMPNDSLYELRALAQRFPYPDLVQFIGRIEREQV